MPRELPVTSTALSRKAGRSSVSVIGRLQYFGGLGWDNRRTVSPSRTAAAKAENMATRAAQRGGGRRRPAVGRDRREAGTAPLPPIRLLTAVPICDGHDSAINT